MTRFPRLLLAGTWDAEKSRPPKISFFHLLLMFSRLLAAAQGSHDNSSFSGRITALSAGRRRTEMQRR